MINWLKEILGRSSPKPQPKTFIWGVEDGPYLREDFPEEVLIEEDIPFEAEAMLVCKIEEDGAVSTVNFWYGSLDEAYEVKKYFDTHMEPLEIHYDR
jgi:hypothetical protein